MFYRVNLVKKGYEQEYEKYWNPEFDISSLPEELASANYRLNIEVEAKSLNEACMVAGKKYPDYTVFERYSK